jgi:hypothetical protein
MKQQTLFDENEFKEIGEFLDSLGHHLPEHKMEQIWNWYKAITKSTEPKPCSCQSAAKLWIHAIDSIKNWYNGNK